MIRFGIRSSFSCLRSQSKKNHVYLDGDTSIPRVDQSVSRQPCGRLGSDVGRALVRGEHGHRVHRGCLKVRKFSDSTREIT